MRDITLGRYYRYCHIGWWYTGNMLLEIQEDYRGRHDIAGDVTVDGIIHGRFITTACRTSRTPTSWFKVIAWFVATTVIIVGECLTEPLVVSCREVIHVNIMTAMPTQAAAGCRATLGDGQHYAHVTSYCIGRKCPYYCCRHHGVGRFRACQ